MGKTGRKFAWALLALCASARAAADEVDAEVQATMGRPGTYIDGVRVVNARDVSTFGVDPGEKLYVTHGGTPLFCEGMDRRALKGTDCKSKSDRPYATLCLADEYETAYAEAWSGWNEGRPAGSRMPDHRIYTLFVPGPGRTTGEAQLRPVYRADSAYIIHLFQDPRLGRITHYTVEHRTPPNRANPAGMKTIWDPRMRQPGSDGTYAPQLSRHLKGKTTEDQAVEFDKEIDKWFSYGLIKGCTFAKLHAAEVRYAADPGAVPVDRFLASCKKDVTFPCCSPTGKGDDECRVNLAVGDREAATNLGDLSKAITASTGNFNLEMIQRMREGLLNTQAAILATTQAGTTGIDGYRLGPDPAKHGQCNSPDDPKRDERLDKSVKQYQLIFASKDAEIVKQRKWEEWNYNRQTVADIIQATWAECLNGHFAIWGGDDTARAYNYDAFNRNRVIGVVSKASRTRLFRAVEDGLKGAGLADDVDFSLFTERDGCSRPEALWKWQHLVKKIAMLEPLAGELPAKGSAGFNAIMSASGIGGVIRSLKREALGELTEKLDSYSDECDDASDEFGPNWIASDDGLSLWKNTELVSSVVRDFAASGRNVELERFQYVYCKNAAAQKKHDKWKNRVLIGATVAAIVVPFAAPALPVTAGTVTLVASGLAAGSAITSTALAVKDAIDAKEKYRLAQATFAAQIQSAEGMDQARRAFYDSLIGVAMAATLSAVDIYQFAKLGGMALKAGKPLNAAEREFYELATKALREQGLPVAYVKQLLKSCTKDDCTGALMRLSSILERYRSVDLALGGSIRVDDVVLFPHPGGGSWEGRIAAVDRSGAKPRVSVYEYDPATGTFKKEARDLTDAELAATLPKTGARLPGGATNRVGASQGLPENFERALAEDAAVLEGTIAKKQFETFPPAIRDTVPGELRSSVRKIRDALADPMAFARWLIGMKRRMGIRMLERAAFHEARGAVDKGRRLRDLVDAGQVDEGIYVEILQEEARGLGWGTIKSLPDGGSLNSGKFLKALSEGDLIWDQAFRGVGHGRDGHVLQILYATQRLAPGEGRKVVSWIGRNGPTGAAVWDDLFDAFSRNSLRSPETVSPFAQLVLPVR